MKKSFLLAIMLLIAGVTQAKDLKKVVLSTGTQMHCQKCEKKVTENLRFVSGIKSIKAEAEKQTITVVYDADKTSPDAMLKSLKKIKYTAEVKSCEPVKE